MKEKTMTASEKLDKVQEMLTAAGVTGFSRSNWTIGGGRLTGKVNGKTVEISIEPDGTVSTSKYAYLLPDNMFISIEAL
jgi:hypothetical protein